jgi:hypothetical protein
MELPDYNALYSHLPFIAVGLAGLVLILAGIRINAVLKPSPFRIKPRGLKRVLDKAEKLLSIMTSVQPLKYIKMKMLQNATILIFEDRMAANIAGVLALLVPLLSIALSAVLYTSGQLWYSKILLTVMGFILPYYLTTLLLDLYKYRMTRQIPRLVDEFRSAFIRHNKIRPAFKECSRYIDRSLGRIIARAADSVFIDENLEALKLQFNDVWFNIFTILVTNFKESGGELTDQLYRLNRTMTRYNSIERKKHKRLIWYEVFAVCTAVFSIPAIFWMNNLILGNSSMIIDAQTNMMVSEVIAFSLLSLVIVRILRRL